MTSAAYLTELAQVHLKFGALDRAEPLLRAAQEKATDPKQKQAVNAALATLLQKKGDWTGAVASYEVAVSGAADPNERVVMQLSLADAYGKAGQSDKAEALLAGLLEGNTAASTGREWLREEAQRKLLSLWRQQPARLDAVIADAEAAIAKNPDDGAAIERLAGIYTSVKPDRAKATECYEKLGVLRPNDRTIQSQAATFYAVSKQPDKVIGMHRRLMEAASTKGEALQHALVVGQYMLGAGKKDEAVAWMKEHFPLDSVDSYGAGMLATFYEQGNMLADAETVLTQAENSAKNPADKAGFKLRRGELVLRQGDLAKGEELIRAVANEFKDDPRMSFKVNWALKRLETAKGIQAPRPDGGQK